MTTVGKSANALQGTQATVDTQPLAPHLQKQARLIAQGFEQGLSIGAAKIKIEYVDGQFEFMIRMRENNGFEALPQLNTETIQSVQNGASKLMGASHILLGTLGFENRSATNPLDNHITVHMRLVEGETGQIVRSGFAEALYGTTLTPEQMGILFSAAAQNIRK